jgi:hypothetical protein
VGGGAVSGKPKKGYYPIGLMPITEVMQYFMKQEGTSVQVSSTIIFLTYCMGLPI